jgi:hypothetical protein
MARLSSQCGLGVFVLAALLPWSHRAYAQSPGEAIRLDYEASPGCPERSELLTAIHDRARRGWSAADDRSFRVRIDGADGGYRGRLEISRKGRVLSVREIRGSTCEVVGTAMAMFVAIALDPAQRSASSEPPPDEAATPTSPPRTITPAPRTQAAVLVQRPTPGWYWGTGLDVASVLHPSVAWGGRVHAALVRFAAGALLAPELRLSWGWADFAESPARGGEATFRFETARAEGCALIGRAPLVVSGCAGFEVGLLRATTRDLPRAGGTADPWYAPMATVRPGWFLSDWFSLEAELGVLFPLTRGSFVVADPERVLYRIPALAVTAAAGFRIWAKLP